jgi:hypothetical protein
MAVVRVLECCRRFGPRAVHQFRARILQGVCPLALRHAVDQHGALLIEQLQQSPFEVPRTRRHLLQVRSVDDRTIVPAVVLLGKTLLYSPASTR